MSMQGLDMERQGQKEKIVCCGVKHTHCPTYQIPALGAASQRSWGSPGAAVRQNQPRLSEGRTAYVACVTCKMPNAAGTQSTEQHTRKEMGNQEKRKLDKIVPLKVKKNNVVAVLLVHDHLYFPHCFSVILRPYCWQVAFFCLALTLVTVFCWRSLEME